MGIVEGKMDGVRWEVMRIGNGEMDGVSWEQIRRDVGKREAWEGGKHV